MLNQYQIQQSPSHQINQQQPRLAKPPMERQKMDAILLPDHLNTGGLFIGDIDCANQPSYLKSKGIGAVITVLRDNIVKPYDSSIKHLKIEIDDHDMESLDHYFSRAFQFIEQNLASTNVMVHCFAGISRSATLVIAYIMRKYKWTLKQSYEAVKNIRKQVQPNPGFMRQLHNFESKMMLENDIKTIGSPHLDRSQRKEPIQYSPVIEKIQYQTQEKIPQLNKSIDSGSYSYLNNLSSLKNSYMNQSLYINKETSKSRYVPPTLNNSDVFKTIQHQENPFTEWPIKRYDLTNPQKIEQNDFNKIQSQNQPLRHHSYHQNAAVTTQRQNQTDYVKMIDQKKADYERIMNRYSQYKPVLSYLNDKPKEQKDYGQLNYSRNIPEYQQIDNPYKNYRLSRDYNDVNNYNIGQQQQAVGELGGSYLRQNQTRPLTGNNYNYLQQSRNLYR